MISSAMGQHERASYLDGLRGCAAVSVVLFHYGRAFFPSVWPLDSDYPAALLTTPLFSIVNGVFAVAIFFVMSGFVIASAAERSVDPFPVQALRRCIRLGLPVAATSMLAYFWILMLPSSTGTLVRLNHLTGIGLTHGPPLFQNAVRMAFYDPWVKGRSYLNDALWTMQTELIGSIGVYAVFSLPKRFRVGSLVAIALVLAVIHGSVGRITWYLGFPIGALMFALDLPKHRAPFVAVGLMVAGFVLGDQVSGTPEDAWPLTIAATFFVSGVMLSETARHLLQFPGTRWLGQISFGLYLTHSPLLLTVCAAIVVALKSGEKGALWLLPPYLIAALGLGWATTTLIDEPTLRMLKRIGRTVQLRPGGAACPSAHAVPSTTS